MARATGTTPRDFPFVWPTWITGLLAGDDQCRWAAWFKAHHTYDKREDGTFDLVKWKAEHNDMVQARAKELHDAGYTCRVEQDFKVKGRSCLLSGKVDIVALHPDDGLIVDCKSWKRKAKDAWQVVVYMVTLPLAWKWLPADKLRGEVRYTDGTVEIPREKCGADERSRVLAMLAEVSSSVEPKRSPSASECRFCDIACCPDRIESETLVETGAF